MHPLSVYEHAAGSLQPLAQQMSPAAQLASLEWQHIPPAGVGAGAGGVTPRVTVNECSGG